MTDKKTAKIVYEVLLVGDSGAPPLAGRDEVLDMVAANFPEHKNCALIFLGDNIYPKGLPEKGSSLRKISEQRLLHQLDKIRLFPGRVIFLSGNHDWNKGKKDGYSYVLRQEEYLAEYFGKRNIMLPACGCPGPDRLDVCEQLSIIAVNSQWWVQKGVRPIGKSYNCSVESEEEFFLLLKEMLKADDKKRKLIVSHLPLFSYGMHGGKFLLKHHIFPGTIYKSKAYIPLPVLGSLLPLYRKFIGAREDLSHPRYKAFRKRFLDVICYEKDIIYAAGHEHNLQYIKNSGNHFLISGSATRIKYVRPGKYAKFAVAEKGFMKLIVMDDKSIILEVWTTKDIKRPAFTCTL